MREVTMRVLVVVVDKLLANPKIASNCQYGEVKLGTDVFEDRSRSFAKFKRRTLFITTKILQLAISK
jgi:hypothetical protein